MLGTCCFKTDIRKTEKAQLVTCEFFRKVEWLLSGENGRSKERIRYVSRERSEASAREVCWGIYGKSISRLLNSNENPVGVVKIDFAVGQELHIVV